MNRKYRICVIGLEHTHARLLYNIFNSICPERIEWIGYAKTAENAEVVENFNRKFYEQFMQSVPCFDNYLELLDQKPDIALVCAETALHADICVETLKRNIHTIVEKPMAMNMEDALKMYRAAKESRAELIINWPVAWFAHFNKAKELADSGIVGKTIRFVYRTPQTWGPFQPGEFTDEEKREFWWFDPKRGGGSIMDYACYSCVLATWFIDEYLPVRVSGFEKNFFLPGCDCEDYAAFNIEYQNAMAQAEGSWSTVQGANVPTGPIVYGTKGTIVCDRYSDEVKVYRKDDPDSPQVYTVVQENKDIPDNFMDYLEGRADLHEMVTLDFNMRAVAVLDACIRSAETGTVVRVEKIW